MAMFKAINVEYDNVSEPDVDDTKELQIEDALKFYQNALKHHSDGPAHYGDAQEAYETLFQSEIFSYPESYNLLRRIELYGPLAEPEELLAEEQDDLEVEGPAVAGDNAPSTLPQVLHLAHKNYGDLLLRKLLLELAPAVDASPDVNIDLRDQRSLLETGNAARIALDHFVDALDKDESDLDLWDNTSLLARALGSERIGRFCLEAILQDGEDNPLLDLISIPVLAQSLAGRSLARLVAAVPDHLSLAQTPLRQIKHKRLSRAIGANHGLDLFPDLEAARDQLRLASKRGRSPDRKHRILIGPSTTWADLADYIYDALVDEQKDVPKAQTSFCVIEFNLDEPGGLDAHTLSHAPSPRRLSSTTDNMSQVLPAYQFWGDDGLVTATNPVQELESLSLYRTSDEVADAPAMSTRKRSSNAADLLDGPDSGRFKSKRLRARESLVESSIISTSATLPNKVAAQVEQDLEYLRSTDRSVFEVFDIFTQAMGAEHFTLPLDHKKCISAEVDMPSSKLGASLPCYDVFHLLVEFDRKVAKHMQLKGDDVFDLPSQSVLERSILGSSPSNAALDIPPLQEGSTMHELLQRTDADTTATSLAVTLLRQLFIAPAKEQSSYMSQLWSNSLTSVLHHVLLELDPVIYDAARRAAVETFEGCHPNLKSLSGGLYNDVDELMQFAQTVFEFVYDHYSEAHASPNEDEPSIMALHEDKDRLDRWADLVQDIARLLPRSTPCKDPLILRYIWTSTFCLALGDNVYREHTITCLQELRAVFKMSDSIITLPNNDALRVMSVEVIDREISKLTTAEFFRTVFDSEQDSVTLIERLEPLLEALHEDFLAVLNSKGQTWIDDHLPVIRSADDEEILKLLRRGDLSVILSLWKRLHDAYVAIEYRAMATNCNLRMIETLVAQLQLPLYTEADDTKRRLYLAKTIGQIANLLKSLHHCAKAHDDSLTALDQCRIASSVTALVRILKITHAFDLFKDDIDLELRVEPGGSDSKTYIDCVFTFHNLELHSWIMLLRILKEGIAQDRDCYMTPDESRMELIRSAHRLVGARAFCHGAGRAFLHYIKDEMGSLIGVDGYDLEFAQIMVDMHGLRCFANPVYEQLDHKSTLQAPLDRATAYQALDVILRNAVNIKPIELHKHPIREAIERVHAVVSRKKPSEGVYINRIKLAASLRAPLNPIDMYRCMSGHTHLYLAPAIGPQHDLATKGWYLLLGNTYMSKYNAQKKNSSGTSDLDWAITYIKHDIEASGGLHWETWYLLAQALDAKIENVLLWSAEKLNAAGNADILGHERAAIHCYMMSLAMSAQVEDVDLKTSPKFAALYGDFAYRIYSSSRAPFDMRAFSLEHVDKFLSKDTLIKTKPFVELSEYNAWRIARRLYHQAIAGDPQKWLLHYMLGKVLWKMYTAKDGKNKPDFGQVLSAFTRAIELLPQDRRDSKKEPILEPHYKIVSIVDKLYLRGDLEYDEAKKTLNEVTPYARQVVDEVGDWGDYVLAVIRKLQHADKSNWHHRFMVRVAKILKDRHGAQAAKDELMQHMFTKTMTLQVWKPEHERPGRHFVYTARYTMWFLDILNMLDDVTSVEQLAKRTRRRGADYLDFLKVWEEIATTYLGLLRGFGHIPVGEEMVVFSMLGHADFALVKEPLEEWCRDPENGCPALIVLREAFEFKKLNGNLIKPGAIDEIIGDAYAVLFNQKGREILKTTQAAQQVADIKSTMSLTTLMNADPADEKSASSASDDDKTLPGTKRRAGVGRREIRSSAEACLSKAAAPEPEKLRLQVVLPKRPLSRQSSSSASNALRLPIDSDDSELSDVDESIVDQGRKAVKQVVSERPHTPLDKNYDHTEFYDPFEEDRQGESPGLDTIAIEAEYNNVYDEDADDEADATSNGPPEDGLAMLVDDDDVHENSHEEDGEEPAQQRRQHQQTPYDGESDETSLVDTYNKVVNDDSEPGRDDDDDDDNDNGPLVPRVRVSSVTSRRSQSPEDETMMGLVASDESDG